MHASKPLIPFFVVDRPISLEILKYCGVTEQNGKFGLMGHANTTSNFQKHFKNFPTKNIVKMVDSGVFTKEGCNLKYKDLFSIYKKMGTDYGIIIDILKDKENTIKSAENAMNVYEKDEYDFKLVGVAQGNDLDEYMECYNELEDIGFENIAIGGLLKKNVNTARYVKLRDEKFLEDVLNKVNKLYNPSWIFTLGCYHPKRHKLLEKYGVFGADYKGWILNYKTPHTILENLNNELIALENKFKVNEELEILLTQRKEINEFKRAHIDVKRDLKAKKSLIDKKTLILRKELANKHNNVEYSSKVQSFEVFLKMNKLTKRKHRFNQVKSYLYKNVFSFLKDNILIINSSAEKSSKSNPVPAIDLYEGPNFKTLKNLDKKNKLNSIHILIISTKYGLISPYDPIEKYEPRMAPNNIKKINKLIKKEINQVLDKQKFSEILININKEHYNAIDDINFNKIKFVKGKEDERLNKTKEWILSKN